MKEAIAKIVSEIRSSMDGAKDDMMICSVKNYKSILFSEENFHAIRSNSGKDIIFIDGGNMEVLGSPSFSVQFIRIYGSIYSEGKKIDSIRAEFFLTIRSMQEKDHLRYVTSVTKINDEVGLSACFDGLIFDPFHMGSERSPVRADIKAVGDAVRRFSELRLANISVAKISTGGMILIDGTLQSTYLGESDILSELRLSATKKGVMLCALAKTTRMLTKSGWSAAAMLSEKKDGAWFYHPVVKAVTDMPEISFARLHEQSRYVFRIETIRPNDMTSIMDVLSYYSSDPAFPGYPYGLIEADRFARVSKQETEQMKIRFMMQSDKRLQSELNALNAHSILDNMG